VDINSPGEPGVTYIMGAGFARLPDPGTPQADALDRLRQGAGLRNRALIERINRRLPDIALDYDREVLPLSPSGTPTERHIVRAYRRKAESAFADQGSRLRFWSEILKADPGAVSEWEPDIPVMEEKIRGALVKRGGIGYERPTAGTFPPIEDFILWVRDCRALPTVAWLDGTSAGEADALTMLERLHALGACALNIIPDRNYRIANPDQRSVKVRKLAEIVAAAETLGFPINIGTEMNKDGQPFVDDTGAEALQPYHAAFMKGARIMVGHTILGRYADYAYVGEAAQIEFGTNAERKNAFFEAAGSLPPLTDTLARRLESLGPQKSLACLHDSASHGSWRL